MPWEKFIDDDEFYTFMGSAGSFIPVRLIPKSAREAMSATLGPSELAQEQDPDEQPQDHK
jgi:hypothetical protein